jgi:3'-phosphoadenosine 5'-phosphosulfate sulfotransferase (PAPS reductase)/FAD synthetase
MKILVFYSGGKDSQACLIKAVHDYGAKNIQAVFCDTGWEHPLTYDHIQTTTKQLGVELIILKPEKYDGFIDMVCGRKRFPSTKRRFCTEILKSIPSIDYVLGLNDHSIVIQGIRKDESVSRSKMEEQCMYFKFYFESYGYDKQGKPKFHTHRKNDVFAYCQKYNSDVLRPIFNWTAQQTIDYIRDNGQLPNPLYYQGFSRVGCFPCIMARHHEVKQIINVSPETIELIKEKESEIGSTFFPPKYIPDQFSTGIDKNGKKFNTMSDIEKYLKAKNASELLYGDHEGFSCMSYYGLCE